MTAPIVKGWCPGAHRPMMSGDGLVVRIRPRLARLTADQITGLADLALRHGSGVIDLTNRANLQIRGVAEKDHDPLLEALWSLGLLDADPALEGRRNILTTPFWTDEDRTTRLARAVLAALPDLPDLPAKIGIAIDTGPRPILTDASADFRIEPAATGLILRADGTRLGRPVTETTAIPALIELAHWFDRHRTDTRRRMAQIEAPLPDGWATTPPLAPAPRPTPGPADTGTLLGAPFGQIDAAALKALIRSTGAAFRVTPWRLFLIEGAAELPDHPFLTGAQDPLMSADACPGAPLCPQATVETRALARTLAPRTSGTLHVSGCAKGCARKSPADLTLTGRNGHFDLVRGGHPWDAPIRTGLTPDDILAMTDL